MWICNLLARFPVAACFVSAACKQFCCVLLSLLCAYRYVCMCPTSVLLLPYCCADSTRRELEPISDWQTQGDEVVSALKREFDAAYSPSWHVIIGKNFGSRVTHEARRMAFFYLGDKAVLVFKA